MKRLLLASLLFAAPAVAQSCPPDEEAMGLCTPPPPVSGPPAAALQGPAHAADTVWDPARMAEVRERELLKPHGGFSGSMLLVKRRHEANQREHDDVIHLDDNGSGH